MSTVSSEVRTVQRRVTLRVYALIVAFTLACFCAACRPQDASRNAGGAETRLSADVTLKWMGSGGGFSECGCGGSWLYATSVKPRVLDVWQWKDALPVEYQHVPLTTQWDTTWVGGDSYLYVDVADDRPHYVGIRTTSSTDDRRQWQFPKGWYCGFSQLSRNGKHVGVTFPEDFVAALPGFDSDHPRMKIALIDPEAADLRWVATLVGRRIGVGISVRSVLPSDDGKYVAVGGWDNSVAMIDVVANEVLWVKKPGANTVFYVAFSPDSEVVYAGGTEGIVFAMDARTGQTLAHWYATESGTEEYGHRISCLAASADGRWVAAGTGPEGLIFVGSAVESKLVAVLEHGGRTVELIHFSPDSKALASFVPGTLKIWNVAQWDQSAGPGNTAGAQPATSPTGTPPATDEP